MRRVSVSNGPLASVTVILSERAVNKFLHPITEVVRHDISFLYLLAYDTPFHSWATRGVMVQKPQVTRVPLAQLRTVPAM